MSHWWPKVETSILPTTPTMSAVGKGTHFFWFWFIFIGNSSRTRIPAQWNDSVNFRKQIWNRINQRIAKGKITEDKEGN